MNIFLSYIRTMDQIDDSVSNFHDRLEHELQFLDPPAGIFFDREIRPGNDFPEEIQHALVKADVLLPLVAPAWFASEWCRKEFEVFMSTRGERTGKVVPVLWVETTDLREESDDKIARQLAVTQYVDWSQLRHREPGDPEVRERTAKLARDLHAHLHPQGMTSRDKGTTSEDFSTALPDLTQTLSSFPREESKESLSIKAVVRSVLNAIDMTSKHLNEIRGSGASHPAPNKELIDLWNDAAFNLVTIDPELARLLRLKAEFWSDPASWNDQEIEHADISMTNLRKAGQDLFDRLGK